MRSTLRMYLIGGTAIAACGLAGLAWAQPATAPPQAPPAIAAPPPSASGLPYAIQQLQQYKGTVARYTLTPRGDVDGLLLSDGTEVHFPPHMSAQLVYAVKPGDAVTVRGLKAYSMPLIDALAISNDASGQTVVDRGPRAMAWEDQLTSAQGRFQAAHGDAVTGFDGVNELCRHVRRAVNLRSVAQEQAVDIAARGQRVACHRSLELRKLLDGIGQAARRRRRSGDSRRSRRWRGRRLRPGETGEAAGRNRGAANQIRAEC